VDVERFWFRQTITGEVVDGRGTAGWNVDPATPPEEIPALYRQEIKRSDEIIRATPLDEAARHWSDEFGSWRLPDLRAIRLHVIAERACHAGHLDAAREHIDGNTGLILG